MKMKQDILYRTAIYIANKIPCKNRKCGGTYRVCAMTIPIAIFGFLEHCTHLMDNKNTISQLENSRKSEYVTNINKSSTNPDKTYLYPYEKIRNSIDSNMIQTENNNNIRKDKIFNLEESLR